MAATHLAPRPRHAEDQPTSGRGETAPPRARPRPQREHIRASLSARKHTRQPRSSLTCSADRMLAPWAADDPVGRAARPPYTIRQARDHPQRAAAHRAALPAKPAPQAAQTGAQQSTAHSTRRRARSTRRHTRDSNTHTRTARAHRTPAQRRTQSTLAHISSSQPATILISHTRAHTPHAGARIGRRREQLKQP